MATSVISPPITAIPSKLAAPSKAKTFGLLLGLVVFFVIWYVPMPGLSRPGSHALAVAALTAIWWILAVMPPAFPAVLACALYFVLRVAKPVDAFSGFVSPSIWMLFFALVMAKGVERSGLGKRIASWLMSKTALSFNGIVVIFPFFLPSNVASVSLTMALAIGIMDALGIERGPNSRVSCGLTCFIAVLTLTMGRAPLTGSIPNFIATGLVHDIAGVDISWISWLKSMWVTEVDVDIETGKVDLVRVLSTTDVGQIIDPNCLTNQMHGGLGAAGLDSAIFEETVQDRSLGRVLSSNLIDYKWRTFEELPDFQTVILETPFEASHRFKAIGVGEITTAPGPSAILMAISNAIGMRMFDYPITPTKILSALGKLPGGKA
jgi:hypothetical protein